MGTAPSWRTWLLALALAVGALTYAELASRRAGLTPSVADTKNYWAAMREQTNRVKDGRPAIAIVGSSRAHQGIDVAVVERMLGRPAVQLALEATTSWAVMEDLCLDPQFRGTILFEAAEFALLPDAWESGRDYVNFHRNNYENWRFFDQRQNAAAKSFLQNRSVALSSQISPWSLLWRKAYGRGMPLPQMRADRQYIVWYSRSPDYVEKMRPVREAQAAALLSRAGPAALAAFRGSTLPRLLELRRTLEQRGGQLILIRMPTSKGVWSNENAAFPRTEYWDRLVAETGVTAVHFRDDPVLSSFECPEGSHLDAADSAAFTERLAEILRPKLKRITP